MDEKVEYKIMIRDLPEQRNKIDGKDNKMIKVIIFWNDINKRLKVMR